MQPDAQLRNSVGFRGKQEPHRIVFGSGYSRNVDAGHVLFLRVCQSVGRKEDKLNTRKVVLK